MTRKGLFITFEGIGPTIFDSQVALHAREMKKHGIELEIWAFETWPRMFAQSKARLDSAQELSQSKVRLFRGLFYYIPFSETINALLLAYYLWRFRPSVNFIHARADYAATVSGIASKFLRIPIIWDCRGDAEAEFKTAYRPANFSGRLFKRLFLRLIRWRTHFAASTCAKAIFVSEELRKRKWRYADQKPSKIIPTSVTQDTFFFSPELRQDTRSRLGFTPELRILLYSGGMVGYQHFAEYVRMFSALQQDDSNLHFLVVTPHVERAQQMLQELPQGSWTLHPAPFREMNAYYNAADFGVLLRERNAVNDVASPTKFGEYCLTGLPVIMNDSVKQSFQFALELGNLIPYRDNLSANDLVLRTTKERVRISRKSAEMLSRESTAARYRSIYDFGSNL
ncbi:MAG: hypothetical protein AMXMBFR16_11920 [Candidatus Uhrbacteria bacterium]